MIWYQDILSKSQSIKWWCFGVAMARHMSNRKRKCYVYRKREYSSIWPIWRNIWHMEIRHKKNKVSFWYEIYANLCTKRINYNKKCFEYIKLISQLSFKTYLRKDTGACLNIKMPSYQHRDSHVRDKTVSSAVLSLTWESPYLGKTVFILSRGPGG